jgi:hypothetical protein
MLMTKNPVLIYYIKVSVIESHINKRKCLPQNIQERRLAASKARLEAIEKRRDEVQKAFKMEQEAEKKEYLKKCQESLFYNQDNVKVLNQGLRFSEVFQ